MMRLKTVSAGRAAVFPVHRNRAAIDNRGMFGSSSIVRRGAASSMMVRRAGTHGVGVVIAMLCGALTLLHMLRTSSARKALMRVSRLQSLRRAIVGVSKAQLADVLGPPRATIGRGDFRTDNTWYYPIDFRLHLALAIEFDQGIARRTHLIAGIY